jgi:hypothetical protein
MHPHNFAIIKVTNGDEASNAHNRKESIPLHYNPAVRTLLDIAIFLAVIIAFVFLSSTGGGSWKNPSLGW